MYAGLEIRFSVLSFFFIPFPVSKFSVQKATSLPRYSKGLKIRPAEAYVKRPAPPPDKGEINCSPSPPPSP